MTIRGSKRKLRNGVWELRLSLGRDPVTGTYWRLSKTFHGSARQADEALRKVIDAAEERDPCQAPLLMLAALTGMRRGELCALRWDAVDLDQGVVEVAGSVVVVPGGLTVKSTKTGRSRRVSPDQVGVALLRAHRARVEDWARQCGVELPEDACVFSPYLDGHSPFRPDNVTSFSIRVREAVGAPEVRLHDLRHFTATQLIGAGVDVRTVAGRLGHADPSVTLRGYSHVLEERDRAAAAVMGQVLGAVPVVEAAVSARQPPAGELTLFDL